MAANPIRILHFIASNFVGGPEKQILHHAVDVREAGCEVWVGSFRDQPEKAEILVRAQERGLPTYESRSSGRFDPRAVWELASFLKRERIQLLCTHGFKANIIGVLARKLAGVPQIAFCRGWTAKRLACGRMSSSNGSCSLLRTASFASPKRKPSCWRGTPGSGRVLPLSRTPCWKPRPPRPLVIARR